MSNAYPDRNRGGWFSDQQTPTGTPSSWLGGVQKCIVAGCCLLATTTGTGASFHKVDSSRMERHQPTGSYISSLSRTSSIEVTATRTATEDIERIRKVLSPSMAELAKSLNVSRQTIYNWLNGEQPNQEHTTRLKDLALAADILNEAGVLVNGALLKRKIFQGKNLFETFRAGGSARDSIQLLIQIARRETNQRERIAARFTGRKAPPHAADLDIMAANEEA